MLEAREITFAHGSNTILQSVSMQLQPGRLLAVIGPNGAGKSTLRKILAGQWTAQRGKVLLNGHTLGDWSAEDLARQRAVLPQSPEVLYPFAVRSVVLLGRSPYYKWGPSRKDVEVVEAVLSHLRIDHLAERDYARLSGGEKQRVQLARILAQVWEPSVSEARYLLLDEPLNNLDLHHQYELMGILKTLLQRNIGILCILHDLNLCLRYATEVVMLHQGGLAAAGPPRDVLTPEHIRKVFKVEAKALPMPDGAGHTLFFESSRP